MRLTRKSFLAAIVAGTVCLASGAYCQTKMGEAKANEEVRAALRREGDDGTIARNVDHFAYRVGGAKARPVTEIVALLEQFGLSVDKVSAAPEGGLIAAHTVAVAGRAFDEFTFELATKLAQRGWEYDGWETVVVRKVGS